jgi:hypothetical protein
VKYSTSLAITTTKIDIYSGEENSVKKSKEFGDVSVPEQNYKISRLMSSWGN